VVILASIFARVGGHGSAPTFSDGLNAAVWVGAGVVALGAIAALAIPRPCKDSALEASANYGRA
jgi:hypothetical protein